MRNKLFELRKQKEWTCDVACKKVGISKTYYWQIEKGKRKLSYPLAIKISKIFKMKPDELFLSDELEMMK